MTTPPSPPPVREVLPGGSVRLASADGTFTYSRPRPGVVLVEITGHDSGQFGTAPLDELTQALQREKPIELFIDTSAASGVSPRVREDWTRFFASNRPHLTAVHVLTASRIVHLAVAVAQLFSNTGNLIQLYSNPDVFRARLSARELRLRSDGLGN